VTQTKRGTVYLVSAVGTGARKPGSVYPCKIGYSTTLGVRLSQIQVDNSEKLHLLWSVEVDNPKYYEALLHVLLRNKHRRGEWYDVNVDMVNDMFVAYEMKTPHLDLGSYLKLRRLWKGWSQTQLSKQSGIWQETISKIENDPSTASLATLEKLGKALGLKLKYEPIPYTACLS